MKLLGWGGGGVSVWAGLTAGPSLFQLWDPGQGTPCSKSVSSSAK